VTCTGTNSCGGTRCPDQCAAGAGCSSQAASCQRC
jgi:hypothetical protein